MYIKQCRRLFFKRIRVLKRINDPNPWLYSWRALGIAIGPGPLPSYFLYFYISIVFNKRFGVLLNYAKFRVHNHTWHFKKPNISDNQPFFHKPHRNKRMTVQASSVTCMPNFRYTCMSWCQWPKCLYSENFMWVPMRMKNGFNIFFSIIKEGNKSTIQL